METKPIIAIFGQMNHGKTSVARLIQSNMRTQYEHDFVISPFAKGIKDIVSDIYGFTHPEIEHWKRLGTIPPGWKISMREALQKIGTECFRAINPNTWIDKTIRNPNTPIIIDDGRFINEAKAVKKAGGTNILVYRYKELNSSNHPSEQDMYEVYKKLQITKNPNGSTTINSVAMNDSPFDILLANDGNLDTLDETIKKHIMRSLAKILNIRKPSNVT